MILTYKYRLKGKRSARQLRRFSWAVNQVWNFCVQTQRAVQSSRRDGLSARWPSFYDLKKLAAGTSRDLGLHAQTIQNVCEQFTKSRDLHKKCPRFRRSGGARRSLGWVPFQEQSRQITAGSVTYLGNTYRFFGAKRRPLPVSSKGGCFVEDTCGRWWICFHVEVEALAQAPGVAVGVDLGLTTLATLPPERPRGIAGLGMREWWCSACGEIHDRDVNAARNILALGLSAQPLVEESRVAHGR